MLIRILRRVFSDCWLVRKLEARNRPELAWRVLATQAFQEPRNNPATALTVNSAERSLRLAGLAMKARAFEWAWVGSADCLSILSLKGQLDSETAKAAQEIQDEVEGWLPDQRIEELREKHKKIEGSHNNRCELRFKQELQATHLDTWRYVARGMKVPKPFDRPY
jgi:hypothetical protein